MIRSRLLLVYAICFLGGIVLLIRSTRTSASANDLSRFLDVNDDFDEVWENRNGYLGLDSSPRTPAGGKPLKSASKKSGLQHDNKKELSKEPPIGQGSKSLPKSHQAVHGYLNPLSDEAIKRQNNFKNLIDNNYKNKNSQGAAAKKGETRHKNVGKSHMSKKIPFKTAAPHKAKISQELINAESRVSDLAFMMRDMKSHLKITAKFPQFKSDVHQRIFVVTHVGDIIQDKTKLKKIKNNRQEYCQRHGYVCLFSEVTVKSSPAPAISILSKYFKNSDRSAKSSSGASTNDVLQGDWVWYLSPDVMITNLSIPISDTLLQPDSLKARLSYNSRFQSGNGDYHPTVRFPGKVQDSSKFELIISRREGGGFMTKSFLIRNTERMQFWLKMCMGDEETNAGSNLDGRVEGNVLQQLYLNHDLLRDYVAIVTPRLLASTEGGAEYQKWKSGDLAAMKLSKERPVLGWSY